MSKFTAYSAVLQTVQIQSRQFMNMLEALWRAGNKLNSCFHGCTKLKLLQDNVNETISDMPLQTIVL